MTVESSQYTSYEKGEFISYMYTVDETDILERIKDKKVVVFGTGEFSLSVSKLLDDIAYYVDNNAVKWENGFHGRRILSPSSLLEENKDDVFIIVASMYYSDISRQLMTMGFIEEEHFISGDVLLRQKELNGYFKPFHERHAGKRAFVIGNGPSLRITDLDKLKGEITFACNKIYLAYGETDWRPTYYVAEDCMVIENNIDDIKRNVNSQKFILDNYKKEFSDADNTIFISYREFDRNNDSQRFSYDISRGVCGGYTVIYIMLQIAYYMGISEIFLLGVDYKFDIPKASGELSKNGEILLSGTSQLNHFHPDYRKKDEKWTMPRLDEQYRAFSCARKAFEKHGRKIYNASRKTALDIFETVNLDTIL